MDPMAQQLALLIAGVIAPFLIQIVKKWGGWADVKAVWLAYAISVVIALVVALVTGQIKLGPAVDPATLVPQLLEAAAVVIAVANLVYEWFIKQKG